MRKLPFKDVIDLYRKRRSQLAKEDNAKIESERSYANTVWISKIELAIQKQLRKREPPGYCFIYPQDNNRLWKNSEVYWNALESWASRTEGIEVTKDLGVKNNGYITWAIWIN